jgi:hypothetical protein
MSTGAGLGTLPRNKTSLTTESANGVRPCSCPAGNECWQGAPISLALTTSRASRSICRICRMVSSLLAGIRFPR